MKKIELKTKAWAKEYIKQNFNGTETALKFAKKGKLMNKNTANAIASENLRKPIYQKEIIREMEDIDLNDKLVNKITKRNMRQKKSVSASNQAIDIYHKVKGTYAPLRKETISVHLTGKELDNRIQDKLNELKTLREQ